MKSPSTKNRPAKNLPAIERLLFDYEKGVFNYVYRLVRQRENAQDLTQDIFIKVYKSLHQIDPDKNIKAWIYKIATNTVYDWLRKKQKKPELFIVDDASSGFETIDEKTPYINIERVRDMEKALDNLSPNYKAVLLLYYYEDLPYEEISEIMNLPLNTLKVHLHRAKKALKENLETKKAN